MKNRKKRIIPENVQRAIYFNDKIALRAFQKKSVEARMRNKKERLEKEKYYFRDLFNKGLYQLSIITASLERHDELIEDL